MSPVGVQPTPVAAQQPTVPGSASAVAVQQQQQSYLNPAMHPAAAAPAGYSYYYPGTAGIMSVGSYYTPMIQMGAMGGLVSLLLSLPLFLTLHYLSGNLKTVLAYDPHLFVDNCWAGWFYINFVVYCMLK